MCRTDFARPVADRIRTSAGPISRGDGGVFDRSYLYQSALAVRLEWAVPMVGQAEARQELRLPGDPVIAIFA